jgi:hypothetical protein
MDMDATKRVMHRISGILPAWLQWRQDTLVAQARFAGEPQTDAAGRRMLELWQRNLEDVAEDEAARVLDRLAVGDLLAPPYGELPVWLRRESLALRRPAEDARRELQFAAEPRFRCLHCRDTGVAHVLDPKFVSAFRIRFEAMTEDDFTATEGGSWWLRAKHWFRAEHGPRKVEYSAACCCNRGERLADRMQRLDERRMPVLHGLLWVRETLAAWYESHDPCEVEFWDVPDFAEANE